MQRSAIGETIIDRRERDIDFEGRSIRCRYDVEGNRIVVTVHGMIAMAYVNGAEPERLAEKLARELVSIRDAAFRS